MHSLWDTSRGDAGCACALLALQPTSWMLPFVSLDRLDALIEDARTKSAQRQQQSGLPAPSVTPPAAAEDAAAASEEVAAQPAAYDSSTAAASQVEQQPADVAAREDNTVQQQQQQQQQQQPAEEQPEAEQQHLQAQQQGEQQPQEPLDLQLDLKAHPELAPLADAALPPAALAPRGLAAPFGLPRNDTLAVHCLHSAALAGGVDAQLALADRWGVVNGRWEEGGAPASCM